MAYQAACPICGTAVLLPDEMPGRTAACARCGTALVLAEGGQLVARAFAAPLAPPANPFADAPVGYPYPHGAPHPFAPGAMPLGITREEALAKAQGPGVILQVFGWLTVLAAPASLLVLLIPEARQDESTPIILAVVVPLGMALGVFTIYCGGQLKSLRSYALVMTSIVLLMLIGFLACPVLALPALWPLVVMLNAQVKAHFGEPRKGR